MRAPLQIRVCGPPSVVSRTGRSGTSGLKICAANMPSTSVDLEHESFGTSSWRLVEMDAGRVSHTPHLCEAFGSTMRWLWVPVSVFSPSTFNKIGRASGPVLVPFLPMFRQTSWSTSRCYSSVIPRVFSGLLRFSCVRVRVCLREFFTNDGWLIFFFFLVARLSTCTFCPQGWGFCFLEYVITDTWNFAIAPGCPWGSRGDGNVASSLCTSLLPARRLQRTMLSVSHRCVQFPT